MHLSPHAIANIYVTVLELLAEKKKQVGNELLSQHVLELQQTICDKILNKTFGNLSIDQQNEAERVFILCLNAMMDSQKKQIQPVMATFRKDKTSDNTSRTDDNTASLRPLDALILGHLFSHNVSCTYHFGAHWWGIGTSNDSREEESYKFLLAILLLMLVLLVLALTLFVLYFVATSARDDIERFYWGEGRLQAVLHLATTAASGIAMGFLSSILLHAPMTALATCIGLSGPMGLIIAGSIVIAILAAGLGSLIMKGIQALIIPAMHADALDPHDPYRFALSPREIRHLEEEGFDVLAIQCALTTLRLQLGEKGIPSWFFRPHMDDMKERTQILQTIRALRRGALDTFEIPEGTLENIPTMTFALKTQSPPPYNPESEDGNSYPISYNFSYEN